MKALLSLTAFVALSGCSALAQQPLKKIAEIPLPDSPTRLDYQSMDQQSGLLYLSHMGAGKLIIVDTKTQRVVANLPGYKTVTGVLAVPAEGKFYGSAAGTHEVVVADLKTNNVLTRVPGADFPDGIAYVPGLRKLFVSDESGGKDLVIDARTNRSLGSIPLGGEAGNTHYDPVGKLIWVAVQTKNEMVSIDPGTQKIVGRYPLAGSDHPHGFYIDAPKRIAYISCEGNNKLLVADLRSMKVLQSFDVTEGPDVLAFDEGLQRLYVGCEGGAVDVFAAGKQGLRPMGKFRAANAHTVSVDQTTHLVYVALKNVGGKPSLWVLKPN
ncbi:MAG: YncE family protein [Armatimonadetes bacterium]|nr:YncE family protein [Armatimonadota bacterium]